jgi:HD superfamily phosphodiesterase
LEPNVSILNFVKAIYGMHKTEKKWSIILEKALEKEMGRAPSFVFSHDIQHIRRVWGNVKRILATGIKADMEVLIAAVYLHDIGRHYPAGVGVHGPISAKYAKKALERIKFPKEKISNVLLSISFHDETFPSSKRKSVESKVLYDADKLDVFGVIGISRFILFYSSRGKTLNEIAGHALVNLPVRFKRLEFQSAKRIARANFRYSMNFFKNLQRISKQD